MFTDYNSIEKKIIPSQRQLVNSKPVFDKPLFSKVINNPNHRAQAEKLAEYRAANNMVRPNSHAAEQMKSIQAQLFEVHKRYKSYKKRKAAENENIFQLLEKIQHIFAAS